MNIRTKKLKKNKLRKTNL